MLSLSIIFNGMFLFSQNSLNDKDDYAINTLIIKLKPEYRNSIKEKSNNALNNVLKKINATEIKSQFPNHKPVIQEKSNTSKDKLVDLSLIYNLQYSSSMETRKIINMLKSTGMFEYVEMKIIPKPFYIPSDPLLASQYYLYLIKAIQAWDVSKGDTNVVIGIIDTGIDFTNQSDLADNIKYNYNDVIDGVDNDGDGYIDNFRGWDLGDGDNNPSPNGDHGTWVAGIAGAKTDNGNGIASVGFNAKILPVKVANSTGILVAAYEGIIYAADKGCQIINCSWGSSAGRGQYGQDVVNYATINKGAIIISASGNDGNEIPMYPASYKNVINVAATLATDVKWTGTNYGINIDLCVPGENIYTTKNGGGYWSLTATSFATPVVSAAAALVKAHYPNYNGLQVGEQLRVTADVIDTIAGNIAYAGKLGSGRINVYRALTEDYHPSVRIDNIYTTDNKDNYFVSGDTLFIKAKLINFLAKTKNLYAKLSLSSAYTEMITDSVYYGAINTLASAENTQNLFAVKLIGTIPVNTILTFKLNYIDSAYNGFEYFEVKANSDYIDIYPNEISTTVTSVGRLAFKDDDWTVGIGYNYNQEQLIYNGGLIVATNATNVSNFDDNSFIMENKVNEIVPPIVSDYDVSSSFNDNNAGTAKLGISITNNIYAWTSTSNNKFLIYEYKINNNNSTDISSLYVGQFADWDIYDYVDNIASYDTALKMGYIYKEGYLYAGIKLLTSNYPGYYAFNNDGTLGSYALYGGFSKTEKYSSISGQLKRTYASTGDVSHVVSAGPYNIPASSNITVAFAIIAGDNLDDIKNSANAAQQKYIEKYLEMPFNYSAYNITDRAAMLRWGTVINASKYLLRVRPKDLSEAWRYYNVNNKTSDSLNTLNVLYLKANTEYEWQFRAIKNDAIYSPFSKIISFTTTQNNLCNTVTNMTENNITSNNVVLTWDTITGATSYMLRWKKFNSSEWSYANIYYNTGSYSVNYLESSTLYEWQIRAFCKDNYYSDFSNIHEFNTLGDCQTPSALGVSYITNTKAILYWNKVDSAKLYMVRWREVSGTWNYAIVYNPTNYLQIGCSICDPIHMLKANTSYEWQIRTFCNDEKTYYSNFSDINYFSTLNVKSYADNIAKIKKDNIIYAYPNPVSNVLKLKIDEPINAKINLEIYDMFAKKLYNKYITLEKNTDFAIDMNEFANGIYLLNITSEEYNQQLKIIKQ